MDMEYITITLVVYMLDFGEKIKEMVLECRCMLMEVNSKELGKTMFILDELIRFDIVFDYTLFFFVFINI